MKHFHVRQWAWLGLVTICLVYGGFALIAGVIELTALVGGPDFGDGAKERAVPPVFVVHALAGGLALVVGAVQFNGPILRAFPTFHRWAGRTYVVSIWMTSVGGLWSALFFDVPLGGRLALVALAVHWFAATTVAYRLARRRRIGAHRRWMIRSFALSLFFVTFPLWTAVLAASPLPDSVGYPVAVLVAWGLNVVLGETWIRRSPAVAGRAARSAVEAGQSPPSPDHAGPATVGAG